MITITRITPLAVITEMANILDAISKQDHPRLIAKDRVILDAIADHIRQAADLALANNRIADVLHQDYPGPRHRRPVDDKPQTQMPLSKNGRSNKTLPSILDYLAEYPDSYADDIGRAVDTAPAYVSDLLRRRPGVSVRRDGKRLRYTLTNRQEALAA